MKNRDGCFFVVLLIAFLCIPAAAPAYDINDYTAYPPFVSNAEPPNILLVLDESGSMQFPAYLDCNGWSGYSSGRAKCGTSSSINYPEYGYDTAKEYYGYFKSDRYYKYSTSAGKFVENSLCSFAESDPEYKIGNTSGCISGNLLNWATMSRIDLLRKALIGGRSITSPPSSSVHTLRGEGGWKTFSDHNLGCTFTLSGGTYPDLDHKLSISNYGSAGTCGYLTVMADGSSIWGSSDKFRYIHQSVSGDFDVKLRVVSAPSETGSTFAKAGLMVRASTNAGSQHVMVMATYGYGLQFARRLTAGGDTTTFDSYVNVSYPVWVRLVRSGDTFTAYYSTDEDPATGPNGWTQHGSTTVSMPSAVLVGMATSSYSSIGTLGKGEYDQFICSACTDDDFDDGSFNTSVWTAEDINTAASGTQTESCTDPCKVGTLSNANIQVDDDNRRGVIQEVSDKDNDLVFDDDAPRFGLMIYASNSRYGCMEYPITGEGGSMEELLEDIQSIPPYSGTPTGEALNEAWDYFIQTNAHSGCNNSAYIGGVGSAKDPWYKEDPDSPGSLIPAPCRKSFVLLISDGQWNGSVDPVVPARKTHVNDIRSMPETQSLNYYTVYIFGDADAGENSMQQTAMYGGFVEDDETGDGNTWPYNRTNYPADSRKETLPAAPCDPSAPPMDDNCQEWDKKGTGGPDGIPDTYYKASDGKELGATLIKAIENISRKSASGTAASVLATTGGGEGVVYQAYFYPKKDSRSWLGYLHSLFVDSYGNLREDTNGNDSLDLASDKIIIMDYDPDEGTLVYKCSDSDGDGQRDSCQSEPESDGLRSINPVWEAGYILWKTPPVERNIFTTIDGSSPVDFTTAQSSVLEPYLRADEPSEADNIINWIRGDDITGTTDSCHTNGYRKRSITINGTSNVWKLGDIVYSTPTAVGQPMENYDLLYGDSSYTEFRYAALNRRQVVYAGANDGMLHAFNAGFYDENTFKYCADGVDDSGNCIAGGHELGQELWAFIPRGLLPHLKWLTDPEYTHVYYVDLKPKITDMKIFTPDDTVHINGWGTVLIGGFRYGGKDISWTYGSNTYTASPEYFALDITDPLNPVLLWTFSDSELGLSMSYPSVAKIGNDWFVIFGSGATDYNANSNLTAFQKGNIFVLKMSGGNNGIITNWQKGTNFWKISTGSTTAYLSDPVSVDVDMNFDVDVIYIGENYQQAGIWNTVLHRITTKKGTEPPLGWSNSVIADINSISVGKDAAKRITSAPSAAMDDRANLWVFFGTGQFLGTSDKNQTDSGGFYAVKDGCWDGTCYDSYDSFDFIDISKSTVAPDGTVSGVSGCGGTVSTWSDLITASYNCQGWAMYFSQLGEGTDFTGQSLVHNGERMITKPLVLGGLVMWTTYIPDIPSVESCGDIGESNVYAVYYETGTAYRDYVFKEQKDAADEVSKGGSTSLDIDKIARVKKAGEGMSSSLSAQITKDGTAKSFEQHSTGAILEIESSTPKPLKSGLTNWKGDCLQ
ncbi:MAG: hypothetical protein GXP46_13835 [Deferribacteres bacterium]|nr:hypothetical protein [Deferribacteres bacterium]